MPSPPVLSVRDAWDRLEAWCRNHLPDLLNALNPGASAATMSGLERTIEWPLPGDVRESLSIHDGQPWQQQAGFIFGLKLLDAEQIAKEWTRWRGCDTYNEEFRDEMASYPQGAIALDYANPGWIPLTRDGGGNHLGVDLAPGPTGSAGQVINFGRDEKVKCVLASTWGEFLLSYASFLEAGALKEISPKAKFWSDNFEAMMGDRHRHDVLVQWRREGRWPLK